MTDGVVPAPSQAKFIQQPRRKSGIPADRSRVSDHREATKCRSSRAVDNASVGARHKAEAVGVGVANESVIVGIDLPVSFTGVAVTVVLERGCADEVELVLSADRRCIRWWQQAQHLECNRIEAARRDLIVRK